MGVAAESVGGTRARRHIARGAGFLLLSLLLHLAVLQQFAGISAWPPFESLSPPLAVRLLPAPEPQAHSATAPRRVAAPEVARAPVAPVASSTPVAPVTVDSAAATVSDVASVDAQSLSPPSVHAPTVPAQTPAGLPASGTLVYQFYWGKARWLAGQAIHQWVIDKEFYTLSSTLSTTGLFALFKPVRLVEVSKGVIRAGRLRPWQFTTQFNDRPPRLAMFNWDKGNLRWFDGQAAYTEVLPGNTYDKISILYQLYLSPEDSDLLSVYVSSGRRPEHYAIRKVGLEDVEIAGQRYPATHLARVTHSADQDQVDIWLSSSTRLPLKIAFSNSAGGYFEQLLAPESLPVD